MKKYNLIFSLGEACSCTSAIRSCGLQNFSYPFDWLYGNNFEGRVNIASSRFDNFINKEDLVFSHPMKEIKGDAYRNTRNEIVFNHDFPHGVPLDESYNEVRAKYDRRINRLLESVENSKKVLAVFVEAPNNPSKLKDKSVLIKAQKKLCKGLKNKNIDILYTVCDFDVPLGKIKKEKINSHITKYSFNYKHQAPDMPDYAVDNDVLKQVFGNCCLQSNKLHSLKQDMLRIIACLIPNKKLRRKIRGNQNG